MNRFLDKVNESIEKAEYNRGVKDGIKQGLQLAYDILDAGVCDMCDYQDFEGKCYKKCLVSHDVEAAKKWITKQIEDMNNG